MRYERQFTEVVEAERIPEDPKLSDLERLRLWTGCMYTVAHDADDHPTICWDVEGRLVFSEPGHWITKDSENCLTWFEDADFRSIYREIEPHLSEVLAPFAEYESDEAQEWVYPLLGVVYT